MRIHNIYKITNIINGKIYIGQTLNPSKRWSLHKAEAKKDNPEMTINKAMKKYGIENFIFEIIASCKDFDSANETEEIIIKQEHSHVRDDKGYNVSRGGSNISPSQETRNKISQSLMGRSLSEEHKNKLRNKVNSVETRSKISQKNKGKTISEESRQKMSQSHKGKPSPMTGKYHSDETKSKLSKIHSGKKMSDSAIKKTSEANKTKMKGNKNSSGHVCSDDAKHKMSIAKRGRTWKLIDGKRVWSSKINETEVNSDL